jgi:exopolysaccharide biosynthesis protein
MKKSLVLYLILPLIFLMTSCDGFVQYDYRIENKTSKALIVTYPTYKTKGSDTTISIQPSEIKQVRSFEEIELNEVDIHKSDDNVLYFLLIDSISKDSTDLCKRELWSLKWKEPYHAIYTLTIKD